MRPSPFGNRPKKFGKKQIPSKKEVEENEERDEFPTEEKESVKKVHKKPKDIYAALDENE